MLVQTLLISLVTAFAMFDYQLGTLYAFRPIVTCPLIGLILGDLPTGLAIGASLELLLWEIFPSVHICRLMKR